MIRAFVLGVVCVALLSSCAKDPEVYTVAAPNGELAFHISSDELGRVHYSVSDQGTPVINDSRLGFAFANAVNFADALSVLPGESDSADLLWEQPWGERRVVRDHHNEQSFTLSDGKRKLTLRVRVFDEGVGFRFEFPDNFKDGELLITDELTEFDVANPSDRTFWNPAYNKDRYEYEYFKTDVASVKSAHTPLTVLDSTDRYQLTPFFVKKGNFCRQNCC